MRKPKIYLETSVIGYLEQNNEPEKMKDTLVLWEEIKKDKYDIYLSDVVLDEIRATKEPKRTVLLDYLEEIKYIDIPVNDEIEKYADIYGGNIPNMVKAYIEEKNLQKPI